MSARSRTGPRTSSVTFGTSNKALKGLPAFLKTGFLRKEKNMKRMVKNGDLIDVEPDGTITVAGKPVGGGGSSDYTAGSNIEISEAKEIAVKSDITGINSIKFAGKKGPEIRIANSANLAIKSNSSDFTYPAINLYRYGYDISSNKRISLIFDGDDIPFEGIHFDIRNFGDSKYAFITKGGKVPPVPSENGTYVLKATVSGSAITYTWVAG